MPKVETRKALIFALRNAFEHNPAVVYKTIFLGETISVLSSVGWQTRCLDADIDDLSLTSIISALREYPDLVLLWCEVHQAQICKQLAHLIKKISPQSKIFVFGRATSFIPQYFERFPFDAVHVDGDREAAISGYACYLGGSAVPVPGVSILDEMGQKFVRTRGVRLEPDRWPLPAIDALSIQRYMDFTERTHGQDYSKRVSITVAKGCELACAYCGATQEEGRIDRRQDVDRILDWVESSNFQRHDVVLHLYAPTLFQNIDWISEFCSKYHERKHSFKWRGVTTIRSLQEMAIVAAAGASGCRELAVGIETISTKTYRTAKSTFLELRNAVANAEASNITVKGLVMLGYPHQTDQDIIELENIAQDLNIILRYTGYTPLHKLRMMSAEKLESINLNAFDRRTYFDPGASRLSPELFYDRISKYGGYFYPNTPIHQISQGGDLAVEMALSY